MYLIREICDPQIFCKTRGTTGYTGRHAAKWDPPSLSLEPIAVPKSRGGAGGHAGRRRPAVPGELAAGLKDSVGERPNKTKFGHQKSVKILPEFEKKNLESININSAI